MVIWTRADLAYTMSVLAKYVNRPGWHHLAALKRVLRYLAGTADYSISWSKGVHLRNIVYGYVDASWADCPMTLQSVTGYVLYLNGGPIAWRCQKQSLVALSSLEAEYYAASAAPSLLQLTRCAATARSTSTCVCTSAGTRFVVGWWYLLTVLRQRC